MEIVLASNNRGKLEELRALLNGTAINCIPQSDLGVPEDEKIPKSKLDAAAKEGGKIGQRARLAKTLSKMN